MDIMTPSEVEEALLDARGQLRAEPDDPWAEDCVRLALTLQAERALLAHLLTAHRVCVTGCDWSEDAAEARKRLGQPAIELEVEGS
jgi:hypothetical protein